MILHDSKGRLLINLPVVLCWQNTKCELLHKKVWTLPGALPAQERTDSGSCGEGQLKRTTSNILEEEETMG